MDVNEHAGSFILVTLGCEHGTLTLSPAAGLRFVSGDTHFWAGEVSFDGSASFFAGLSTANAALGSITYRPVRNWNGNDTLTVAADDRGWSTEVSTIIPAFTLLQTFSPCRFPIARVSAGIQTVTNEGS